MAEIAAGGLASIAGGKVASMMEGNNNQPDIGAQITKLVNNMNSTLNTYLDKALGASSAGVNQGIATQQQGLNTANGQMTDYLDKATRQAQINSLYGQQQSHALMQPYMNMGANASDAYMDSLGLGRPVVGSAAVQNALYNNSMKQMGVGQLGQAPTQPTGPLLQSPGSAPTGDNINISKGLLDNFITSSAQFDPSHSELKYSSKYAPGLRFVQADSYGGLGLVDNQNVRAAALADYKQQQLAPQLAAYNLQTQAYQQQQQQLQNYTNYQNQVNSLNQMYGSPDTMQQSILNAYNSGYFNR